MNIDQNMEQQINRIIYRASKFSDFLKLTALITTVVGITAMLFTIYRLAPYQSEAEKTLHEKELILDSLTILKRPVAQIARRDSVVKFINIFLTAIKDDRSLSRYYSDPMDRFYLKKNVSLDTVRKERAMFLQKHPRSKVAFVPSDINVALKDNNDELAEIFVNAFFYEDSLTKPTEIVYQIKLNKKYKVTYIRNLFALKDTKLK